MPISVQEAYYVLLNFDKTGCSLDDYKVYNQFVRYGHRLQRHFCNKFTNSKEKILRQLLPRLKATIILPHNGLRIFNEVPEKRTVNQNIWAIEYCSTTVDRSNKRKLENICTDNDINKDCVHEVIEDIICHLEINELKEETKNEEHFEQKLLKDCNYCGKSRYSESSPLIHIVDGSNIEVEVEVISNCTVLRKRKIFQDMDKMITNHQNKRKKVEIQTDDFKFWKQGKEVIYLSDDEIEEICKPLTRVNVLNELPGVNSHSFKIASVNLKNYLPCSIQLQKDIYYYYKIKWPGIDETDNSTTISRNILPARHFHKLKQNNVDNYEISWPILNSNAYARNKYIFDEITNTHESYYATMQQTNVISQFRYLQYYYNYRRIPNSSVSANNYNRHIIELMGSLMNCYRIRNMFLLNGKPNFCIPTVVSWQNSFIDRVHRSCRSKEIDDSVNHDNRNHVTDIKKPSTWKQLKKELQDEHIITIEDEHCKENNTDPFSLQRDFHEHMKPLIHVKRTTHSFDLHNGIKLIKSYIKKTPQKRSFDTKIVYNIYSNSTRYKKTNPGCPNCQLVVVRENLGHYLNSEEVDQSSTTKAKTLVLAHVTKSSISYLQFGNVEIPELI